jgi:hypothetical protein
VTSVICNLFPNRIRKFRWRRKSFAGYVTHMGEIRNEYKILVLKHKQMRSLRRTRSKGEKIMTQGGDWINLAQDRNW